MPDKSTWKHLNVPKMPVTLVLEAVSVCFVVERFRFQVPARKVSSTSGANKSRCPDPVESARRVSRKVPGSGVSSPFLRISRDVLHVISHVSYFAHLFSSSSWFLPVSGFLRWARVNDSRALLPECPFLCNPRLASSVSRVAVYFCSHFDTSSPRVDNAGWKKPFLEIWNFWKAG